MAVGKACAPAIHGSRAREGKECVLQAKMQNMFGFRFFTKGLVMVAERLFMGHNFEKIAEKFQTLSCVERAHRGEICKTTNSQQSLHGQVAKSLNCWVESLHCRSGTFAQPKASEKAASSLYIT